MVALFALCMISLLELQLLAGPNPIMSKQRAIKECSESGSSLLSYRDAKANPAAPAYLNQLGNGESAWIEGYAKLSPFLSWQGCFNTTNIRYSISMHGVAIKTLSIYQCWRACQDRQSKHYDYLGIKERACYCILQNQRYTLQDRIVNDTYCSFVCNINAMNSCGGNTFMSVYGVLEEKRIHWGSKQPSSNLCVYVKKWQNKFEAFTSLCHSLQPVVVNGYICTNSAWSGLSTNGCSRLNTAQGTYCIIEKNGSRIEASEACGVKKGMLADLGAEKTTPALLNPNFNYWIGIHRAFGIANTYMDGETVCLSAMRVDNILHIEPDDCSAQKFYLCESLSNEETKTSLTSTSSPNRKTDNETFLTTQTPPDLGSEGNNESPITYIVPSVLIVIFIVLLILFIAYRRRKKRKPQTMRPLEDSYDVVYDTDNVKNEYSFSSGPGLNADSKCLIVKSKPDKPERQTLKRRTTMSEYENFTLKGNTKEVRDKKKEEVDKDKDDEYDKLKFNSMPRSIKYGLEESNVYNHIVETGHDNYDTMKSVKSFHAVVRVDETYSRMNDKLVFNDYCGLQGPTELLDNTEGINNASYNTKKNQNSALHEEVQPRHFLIIDDEE